MFRLAGPDHRSIERPLKVIAGLALLVFQSFKKILKNTVESKEC